MGMIDWMQDVKTDSEMILSSLKKIREAPYEPGKDVEAYP
jgi:hypothetical protein